MFLVVTESEGFTLKLGGAAPAQGAPTATAPALRPRGGPSPRMSTMMAVLRSTLYLYGGVLEKDEKQFYLSDMYSLGEFTLCQL